MIPLILAANDNTTNLITSLSSPTNGFTIGNNATTGASGVTYHYAAFKDLPQPPRSRAPASRRR